MNPITIYFTGRIISFRQASRFFFGGFVDLLPEIWTPFVEAVGVTAVGWVFLYILYKKKIFLKV